MKIDKTVYPLSLKIKPKIQKRKLANKTKNNTITLLSLIYPLFINLQSIKKKILAITPLIKKTQNPLIPTLLYQQVKISIKLIISEM